MTMLSWNGVRLACSVDWMISSVRAWSQGDRISLSLSLDAGVPLSFDAAEVGRRSVGDGADLEVGQVLDALLVVEGVDLVPRAADVLAGIADERLGAVLVELPDERMRFYVSTTPD